ncbi:MAG: hypothetical protein ACKOK7_07360 [Solirubrobacterales bacterium]
MTPNDREIHDTELSSIVLPSGRRLEILYVDGEPFAMNEDSPVPEGGAPAVDTLMLDALDDLTLCGSCDSPLVQPTGWESHGAEAWQIELRCPECEQRATTVIEDGLAEQLTLFHERARALVELSMVRLASDNAELEIERFARALEQDLILPEDF